MWLVTKVRNPYNNLFIQSYTLTHSSKQAERIMDTKLVVGFFVKLETRCFMLWCVTILSTMISTRYTHYYIIFK